MTARHDITPGLLVLHGNRLELLRDAVVDWLGRSPLAPLEQEVFLVQSNGAAEWLKMALARAGGVCAATRVELPARFLWRTYRQVLGRAAVPTRSALDKDTLTWRLMRLLTHELDRPGFAPLAGFLRSVLPGEAGPGASGAGLDRRLQLAERLADLYDQYQVYRADWLAAWAAGRDVLVDPSGHERPLPDDQRWQAQLWRDVLAELDEAELRATRPQVHRDVVAALGDGLAPAEPLPRRVVLFGASHLPGQTLEALAALAGHTQVLLAIPNPCRFHWADIIDRRELLRATQRRHPLRDGRALDLVPMEAMHAHAHPLLAAWGRQGRDFMRQLDAFDEAAARQRFDIPRVDLFDETPPVTLLDQVQAHVRDLTPLADHPKDQVVAMADRSIVFHIAHSAQREVEILHDQLLQLLATPAGVSAGAGAGPGASASSGSGSGPGEALVAPAAAPLRPRDIVVMVPDIEVFAPAIRAVFGQLPRDDARFIPYEIADLAQRANNPLLLALDWLLRAPTQRFRLTELRDLLDVPAIARRFGLETDDLPRLSAWMAGAGVRWGLDAEQRIDLGLGACGEQNSWRFGLRRMLLGYASGAGPAWVSPQADAVRRPPPEGDESTGGGPASIPSGIEPYDEIGGLDAALVGALADLVDRLTDWWRQAGTLATPDEWAARARALLTALALPVDERERLTVAALNASLASWLDACESAAFVEAVPVSVLREAWLGGVDQPGSGRRFLAGGVTFCTLLPLRAVPFEVVCLLGMNDGDYPRQTRRSDFDLMGLAGQQRPGDRSRRDDDRYLMLEAVLSARRVLYVSWAGRSARDNSDQPPSVLVAQLRDYLAAGWRGQAASHDDDAVAAGKKLLAQLDTEHPLQPFSRRYFEAGADPSAAPHALYTWAREWRAAHGEAAGDVALDAGSTRAGDACADAAGMSADAGAHTAQPSSALRSADASPDGAAASATATVAFDVDTPLPPFELGDQPLRVDDLARFLENPVKAFFKARLDVVFARSEEADDNDEVFAVDGLADYQLLSELLAEPDQIEAHGATAVVRRRLAVIRGSGRLPMARVGERVASELAEAALPMLTQWQAQRDLYPDAASRRPLAFEHAGVSVMDWLDGLRSDGDQVVWIDLTASRLADKPAKDAEGAGKSKRSTKPPELRLDKLVRAWVRLLLASACDHRVCGVLIGRHVGLRLNPLPRELAERTLRDLIDAWRAGMDAPLPLPLRTGLAQARELGTEQLVTTYEGGFDGGGGEVREPCLARLYPDFDALVADGQFEHYAKLLLVPLVEWAGDYVERLPSPGKGLTLDGAAAKGRNREAGVGSTRQAGADSAAGVDRG